MRDGHHEILLLLLQFDLPPYGEINKNGAGEKEDQESHSFADILGSFAILFKINLMGFYLISGIIGSKLMHFKVCHLPALLLQGNKPPDKRRNDIDQEEPVNDGGNDQSLLFKKAHDLTFSTRMPTLSTCCR